MSVTCRSAPTPGIILIDGKIVELILWKDIADFFVGPDPQLVNHVLATLQAEMNRRYEWLTERRRRKVVKGDGMDLITIWIDELSVFTSVYGTKESQERFLSLLMDLVQRGPAAGIVVVAATQRPSADIVPTRVRDVFSYRVAFRCATEASRGDIILGTDWAKAGFDASKIHRTAPASATACPPKKADPSASAPSISRTTRSTPSSPAPSPSATGLIAGGGEAA